jgi:hypothetical protein
LQRGMSGAMVCHEMRMPAISVPGVLVGSVALLAVVGCGHPATRAECDELFTRTAQIELDAQRIKDPNLVERRLEEARAQSGEAFAKDCVNKRITKGALECVRKASTSEQFDKCLD